MSKQEIKRIIVRYKYIVHIMVGVLGGVLIGGAAFIPKLSEEHQAIYDFLMGMGCSIIATVVVTIILLILIPDSADKDSELKEWGIVNINEERSNIKISSKRFPKNNLDFIAFGLHHFREANQPKEEIVRKVKKGLNIRILVLNPYSIFVLEQQKMENQERIQKDILDLIKWVDNINDKLGRSNGNGCRGSISIKLYDNIPLSFYCCADDNIYVGPYMPGLSSSENITYQFKLGTKGGNYYKNFFEKIWSGESNINIVNTYEDYIIMNQKKGIETILEYFSGLLKNEDGKPVIAVVAIFKGELRRTFFSCNKPREEKYVCHGKREGSIGELIKLIESKGADKYLLFNDYRNGLAFVNEYQNRNEFIKKIEHRAGKLKQDDTCAILSVPLVVRDKMIGALTFDFAELPENYMTRIDELSRIQNNTQLQNDNYSVLEEMFQVAKACEKIIINLLGQSLEVKYKNLYEEEWRK